MEETPCASGVLRGNVEEDWAESENAVSARRTTNMYRMMGLVVGPIYKKSDAWTWPPVKSRVDCEVLPARGAIELVV